MKYIVLANPKSTGNNWPTVRALLDRFVKHHDARLVFLGDSMFTGLRIREEGVIIAGGDGTFQAALNHKPFRKKAIGFFPLGAGNAVHASLHEQRKLLGLLSGKLVVKELDVLHIRWHNGSIDTVMFSMGVDALIMERTKRQSFLRSIDYAKAAADVSRKSHSWNATWVIDGKHHQGSFTNVLVGKIPYYGYAIKSIPGNVKFNDGKIYGLFSDGKMKPLDRMLHLFAMHFGLTKKGAFRCKSFTVEGEEFPIQGAGEFLGRTNKVIVRVLRKQRILAPSRQGI